MSRTSMIIAALALALGQGVAQEATPHPLAIKVRHAVTVSGVPIDDAVIVIEKGKITAIGTQATVDVPDDADVIEAGQMWATPGFIHPASIAMTPAVTFDLSGKNNNADRLVADDLAPTWPGVKSLAKAGFTRVNVMAATGGFAGQSVLIKPLKKLDRPIRPNDVIATKELALCMGFEGRTTNKTFWKDTLAKARKYREDKTAAAKARPESAPASRPESAESKPAEGERPASRPAEVVHDPKITPIADLLDAKMPGILAMGSAASVLHLLPVVQDTAEFKPALLLLDEAWRVLDQVKKLGLPVILQTNRINKPDTSIEIVPVRDYVDGGVAVALIPETSFNAGYEGFVFHLGELVRKGVARDIVLRAVTLTPAEILGIQKDVGSLDKGKAGDVLLWSADPLSPEAELVRVIVGGVTIYDVKEKP